MANLGPWRRRERPAGPTPSRRLGCFWLAILVILLIVLLGLLFGGYLKGTKSEGVPTGVGHAVVAAAPG